MSINKEFLRDRTHVEAHLSVREYLLTKGDEWTTQREITDWTAVSGTTMRQLCQMYPASYVSSTSGYKLAARASRSEVQHCVTTLLSRSEKMLSRASALSGRLA